MRKDKIENIIMRRVITWTMTVIIALSSIGGNFGVMTVYADELETGEAPTATEVATSAVETATSAASAATSAADAVENAVEEATTAVSAAEVAVNNATENISKENISQSLEPDTKADLQNYSTQVQDDQTAINNIDNLSTITIDNADGNQTNVALKDYVAEQITAAQNAADEAKKSLEVALAIETNEVTPEVEAKVEEVKAAAKDAEEAYNAAVNAKDAVAAQKDAAIEQYNLYAMAYGLPKYDESGVTYTAEEAMAAINEYNQNVSEENKITYMGTRKAAIANEIKEDLSSEQQAEMENVTNLVQAAETKVIAVESAVESAEIALTVANQAAKDAESAIDKVKKEEEAAKIDEENKQTDNLSASLQDAKEVVAKIDVNEAKEDYEAAAEKLANLKATVESYVFDSVTLAGLKDKIEAAERAVVAAESKLWQAKAAKAAAENYANWAEELISYHETRVYAQAKKDATGKMVALTENSKEYDMENEKMKSRPQSDFISVTVDKSSVEVPYAIYKDYVQAMYEKYKAVNTNNGKGTSTGTNMDIIYWVVDEDGNLTGDHIDSMDALETGRYFVGYAFKQESDGYHIDGVMYDYTKPEIVPTTPDTTPEGGGNPTGGNPGGTGRTAGTAGDVLGAKREDIAMVADQGDVLGATRAPKTSDSAKAILWMLVMGSSAIGAVVAMASKRKEA